MFNWASALGEPAVVKIAAAAINARNINLVIDFSSQSLRLCLRPVIKLRGGALRAKILPDESKPDSFGNWVTGPSTPILLRLELQILFV
jgi:hypothetical protein